MVHLTPSRHSPRPSARKALGQHFLRDEGVLAKIAGTVRLPEGGFVLEVGPGTGQLTEALLDGGFEVVGVEIEERLLGYLRNRFRGREQLKLIHDDARTAELAEVVGDRPFVAVGNLPYFAANPIIRRFLEREPRPVEAVFMVQKEVGREVCAVEGDFSLLTVSVRVYAEPEYLFDVPPEAFDPPPKVMSGVVRLTLREQPLVPQERIAAFFELVSKLFRNPRKQIHNALSRSLWLAPDRAKPVLELAGIEPTRRAETLTVADWLALLDSVEQERLDA